MASVSKLRKRAKLFTAHPIAFIGRGVYSRALVMRGRVDHVMQVRPDAIGVLFRIHRRPFLQRAPDALLKLHGPRAPVGGVLKRFLGAHLPLPAKWKEMLNVITDAMIA